mmetsp:Transcript_63398/g.138041  ORF Transcript_63398/g.138041 Transcript_63398/m.138041 type:complete len:118 (-) Transcript_63398:221-574(-)
MFSAWPIFASSDIVLFAAGCFFTCYALIIFHMSSATSDQGKSLWHAQARPTYNNKSLIVPQARPASEEEHAGMPELAPSTKAALPRRENVDLLAGLALLEQYGVLGAPCGLWKDPVP